MANPYRSGEERAADVGASRLNYMDTQQAADELSNSQTKEAQEEAMINAEFNRLCFDNQVQLHEMRLVGLRETVFIQYSKGIKCLAATGLNGVSFAIIVSKKAAIISHFAPFKEFSMGSEYGQEDIRTVMDQMLELKDYYFYNANNLFHRDQDPFGIVITPLVNGQMELQSGPLQIYGQLPRERLKFGVTAHFYRIVISQEAWRGQASNVFVDGRGAFPQVSLNNVLILPHLEPSYTVPDLNPPSPVPPSAVPAFATRAPFIPPPFNPAFAIPAPFPPSAFPAFAAPAPFIPAPVIPAPVIPAPVIPAPVIPAPVIRVSGKDPSSEDIPDANSSDDAPYDVDSDYEAPSGRAPSGKAPSGRAPSGKAPSGKAPSGKAPSGKAPSSKGSSSKGSSSKDPSGQGSSRISPYGQSPYSKGSSSKSAYGQGSSSKGSSSKRQ